MKYRYTGRGTCTVHGKSGNSYTFSAETNPPIMEMEVDESLDGINGIENMDDGTTKKIKKKRGG